MRKIILASFLFFFSLQFVLGQESYEIKVPKEVLDDIQNGFLASASEKLSKFVAENPENYWGRMYEGKVYATMGQYGDAKVALQKAMVIKTENNIEDSSVYNSLGWVTFLRGEPNKAIEQIHAGLTEGHFADPKIKEASLNNLGLIYMDRNDFASAGFYFKEAKEKCNSTYGERNLKLLEKFIQRKKKEK